MVHEAKVVRFLQEEVLNRRLRRTRKNRKAAPAGSAPAGSDDDAGEDVQTLKYNSIRLYKSALVDHWSYQKSRSLHIHPHPAGNALNALMKDCQRKQHSAKKAAFEDRGKGTVADGYDEKSLRAILNEFWRQGHSTKSVIVGGTLRGHLDFILGHLLLARGESRRFAELPDLQLLMFDNEGPSPCPALLYIMSNGKTNQNGRIEYSGLLRHKDLSLCGMSALAVYFFWRWEQSGELFPSFKSNKAWYNIRVLAGESIFLFIMFLKMKIGANRSTNG